MPLDPRAELTAEYHAAKSAGNNKGAMDILVKLAKIDALASGKAKPVPEAEPDSFPTRTAAREYLDSCGWSGVYSTFCLHVEQRKIVPGPDGTFSRSDLDSYALANLVNNPDRAEKTTSDELTLEAKQLENRRLRMKVEQQEGLLINSDDVKCELENMLVSFRSRVLLIPRKLSAQLSQMSDAHQVETLLNREMRDCLTTLAQYSGADTFPGSQSPDPE